MNMKMKMMNKILQGHFTLAVRISINCLGIGHIFQSIHQHKRMRVSPSQGTGLNTTNIQTNVVDFCLGILDMKDIEYI